MTLEDARRWIERLDAAGVPFWVDGGWGVDALLGEQTRPHDDLDLVVEAVDGPVVERLLEAHGYRSVETSFTTPVHAVWRDDAGREIDLHLVEITLDGDGRFDGEVYPAAGLAGRGSIEGRAVRCITPEVQLAFHLGYDHDEDDRADVLALCRRFELPVPGPYRR